MTHAGGLLFQECLEFFVRWSSGLLPTAISNFFQGSLGLAFQGWGYNARSGVGMRQHALVAAFVCSMVLAPASSPQISQRLQDCMAIPTLAEDIRQRGEPADQGSVQPRIKLSRLIFRGQTTLPPSELRLIARSLTEQSYSDPEWLEELRERIRDAWQHRGYFEVVVGDPLVRQLPAAPGEQRAAVSISVDAQQLYKLRRIAYVHNTAFSSAELRSFFPIEDGDTVDTYELQQGIETMRKAYAEKGFINMTAIPEFDIDDVHSTLTVTLDLDEGKQFRFGQITVHGMDPALAEKLLHESGVEKGTIFDPALVSRFFERNRDMLPADAEPFRDTVPLMDETNGTVDLIIDVFQCSQLNELNGH